MGPTEVRPSLCGSRQWQASLLQDSELLIPGQRQSQSSPTSVAAVASPLMGVSGAGAVLPPSQAQSSQEPTGSLLMPLQCGTVESHFSAAATRHSRED